MRREPGGDIRLCKGRRRADDQFSAADGPEMFPGRRVALVEGRSLTWYGPSLVRARSLLLSQLGEGGLHLG